MNAELVRIVDSIARDKNIEKDSVFADLELAMESAVRKAYGPNDEVKISIDRFDSIDPSKGFQLGERVLKETAQLLKRVFRPTDIIIRHGVADFMVILPETAKHGALTAVRRLLTKVEDLNRRRTFDEFVLQLSIGVADYTKGRDVRDSLVAVETRVQIYHDTQSPGS